MAKANKYANGENYSYGVSMPIPSRYSKSSGTLLPNIRVKETPVHLDQHSQAPAVLSIVDGGVTMFLTNRFYLTGVQEAREEKAQIIETFGAPSYTFFGEKTRIYNFTGQLLETKANKASKYRDKYLWASSFLDLYDNHLRGTKLAENNYEAVLTFKNTRLRGFILNVNVMHNANSPMLAQFSFSMIVRKQETIKTQNNRNTIKSLYSVNAWIKTDALLEKLTDWHQLVTDADEAEITARTAVEEKLHLAKTEASKEGNMSSRLEKYYKAETVESAVRNFVENIVNNGYKSALNKYDRVDFAALTSDDPAIVTDEATRVDEMIRKLDTESSYLFFFSDAVGGWWGEDPESRSWNTVKSGLDFTLIWSTKIDTGENWLTALTAVLFYTTVFDGIVATGPYAEVKGLMK
ncbi:MAG: hypothetical protein H8D23_00855 [Candidatus Brocadiales bacterium]|nr:hypothetical protein [Candidatus Brocadiales bacterium]